ncbi:MAG: hypothetical protein GJ680_12275 [Alteromonadaceae bacterium]|nr:hypothetical protein [Alteromonadaceae bacterium]
MLEFAKEVALHKWFLTCLLLIGISSSALAQVERRILQEHFSRTDIHSIIDNSIVALQQEYLHQNKVKKAIFALQQFRDKPKFNKGYDATVFLLELEKLLINSTGDRSLALLPITSGSLLSKDENFNGFTSNNNITTQRLQGNIGLLSLAGDFANESAIQAVDKALAELHNVSALVIDLRDTGTTNIDIANSLLSHFVKPNTHLSSVTKHSPANSFELYSIRKTAVLEGARDIPVFVLHSAFVEGVWEWFSFTLQGLGRANIVGEDTMGIAQMYKFIPVGANQQLKLTYATLGHPVTKQNWQEKGVQANDYARSEEAIALAVELANEAIFKFKVE